MEAVALALSRSQPSSAGRQLYHLAFGSPTCVFHSLAVGSGDSRIASNQVKRLLKPRRANGGVDEQFFAGDAKTAPSPFREILLRRLSELVENLSLLENERKIHHRFMSVSNLAASSYENRVQFELTLRNM